LLNVDGAMAESRVARIYDLVKPLLQELLAKGPKAAPQRGTAGAAA
jgi:hypothetical protein